MPSRSLKNPHVLPQSLHNSPQPGETAMRLVQPPRGLRGIFKCSCPKILRAFIHFCILTCYFRIYWRDKLHEPYFQQESRHGTVTSIYLRHHYIYYIILLLCFIIILYINL